MPQPEDNGPRVAFQASVAPTDGTSRSELLLQRRLSRPLTVPTSLPPVMAEPQKPRPSEEREIPIPTNSTRRRYHSADMAVLIHSFSSIDLHEKLVEAKRVAGIHISGFVNDLTTYVTHCAASLSRSSLKHINQLQLVADDILNLTAEQLEYSGHAKDVMQHLIELQLQFSLRIEGIPDFGTRLLLLFAPCSRIVNAMEVQTPSIRQPYTPQPRPSISSSRRLTSALSTAEGQGLEKFRQLRLNSMSSSQSGSGQSVTDSTVTADSVASAPVTQPATPTTIARLRQFSSAGFPTSGSPATSATDSNSSTPAAALPRSGRDLGSSPAAKGKTASGPLLFQTHVPVVPAHVQSAEALLSSAPDSMVSVTRPDRKATPTLPLGLLSSRASPLQLPRPSMTADAAEAAGYMLCRICEDVYLAGEMEEHTQQCAAESQREQRMTGTTEKLRALERTLVSRVEPGSPLCEEEQASLKLLTSICVRAINLDAIGTAAQAHGRAMLQELTSLTACLPPSQVMAQHIAKRLEKEISELLAELQSLSPPTAINVGRGRHRRQSSLNMPSATDFEILKPISKGAFGRVFLARKRTTGDFYAIKVIRKIDMVKKNQVERVRMEREILARVNNPFVVKLFYSFQTRENLYLVLDYLPGGDVGSLLEAVGCITLEHARAYISECVLALDYLHSQNIVHRDLKPDNMLINKEGHIVLTDFGLSELSLLETTDPLIDQPMQVGSLVRTGSFGPMIGTPTTPSRTSASNVRVVGHGPSVDWWALGVILYEMLSGCPPFNSDSAELVFANILNGTIEWGPNTEHIPPVARDLITRLLVLNPLQRLGKEGAAEVKMHPFFAGVDWDMLLQQDGFFVPEPEHETDTAYFSRPFTVDALELEVLSGQRTANAANTAQTPDSAGTSFPTGSMTFGNFSFRNVQRLRDLNESLLASRSSTPVGTPRSHRDRVNSDVDMEMSIQQQQQQQQQQQRQRSHSQSQHIFPMDSDSPGGSPVLSRRNSPASPPSH
eukprot:TRINITY_DN1513_c0_g1_i2.p1 TRINITY_DN1513_c0_g1~~TRINITY_DN1513_c0_g1_i2.p1  ORF type:complete len:1007 (+),score=219.75 TRINITY_DN1513_c0_g1_i2:67-3087(+)